MKKLLLQNLKKELSRKKTKLSHLKIELSHLSFGHLPFSQREERTRKAFTLVELIVVITILAILATIAFVSIQNYTVYARDVVRTSDLGAISRAITIKISEGGYAPKPEKSVEITSSGTLVMYQGEFTQKMGSRYGVNGDLKDPLDGKNYTYSTDANLFKHELAGFLEGDLSQSYQEYQNNPEIYTESYALEGRTIVTKGDKLGIIFTPEEVPVHELSLSGSILDIVNTTDTYKVYFDNNETIEGTGSTLSVVNPKASCKRILEMGLVRKGDKADGVYTISPVGEAFDVYCDMTTEGGGWTLVANWSTLGIYQTFPLNPELSINFSYGVYDKNWGHSNNYYRPFSKEIFEDIIFLTGNKKYYCGFNYRLLMATKNTSTASPNIKIKYAKNTIKGVGELTNSYWRPSNIEDPWIGCAGTHHENSYGHAMTFWGERGYTPSSPTYRKHSNLAQNNNGIGVFIR